MVLLYLGLSPAGGAETVYRKVGEDGTITYSDHPVPGAEAVELHELPTIDLGTPPVQPKRRTVTPLPTPSLYSSVVITQPTQDSAAWHNAGQVNVSVTTQPALQADHSLVLYLDGKRAAAGTDTALQLTGVQRGTHLLEAAVYVGEQELKRSAPVRFHVLKHSVHSPQRRREAPSGDAGATQQQRPTPSRPDN